MFLRVFFLGEGVCLLTEAEMVNTHWARPQEEFTDLPGLRYG